MDDTETTGRNRRYHCEMLLRDLDKWQPERGDTRGCLFIDRAEVQILSELLHSELETAHA